VFGHIETLVISLHLSRRLMLFGRRQCDVHEASGMWEDRLGSDQIMGFRTHKSPLLGTVEITLIGVFDKTVTRFMHLVKTNV
jgi:hypothetical protein